MITMARVVLEVIHKDAIGILVTNAAVLSARDSRPTLEAIANEAGQTLTLVTGAHLSTSRLHVTIVQLVTRQMLSARLAIAFKAKVTSTIILQRMRLHQTRGVLVAVVDNVTIDTIITIAL